MYVNKLHAAQNSSTGELRLNVTSSVGMIPVQNATITITPVGEPENVLDEVTTNESGQSETLELPAPPIEYSLEPGEVRPYSEYNIHISAPGYEPADISGTEILPDVTALQPVSLVPEEPGNAEERIVIPDHTLYGDYPAKIPEAEIKPIDESGEIVLSRVVIPEYVVVHDGSPNNPSAPNYYVRYKDYIKNVASSEIYATWPESAIYANILCIMSFTLNRVYTEWSVGYPFWLVFFSSELPASPPFLNASSLILNTILISSFFISILSMILDRSIFLR